ncbi:universal stress protein [Propionibacteriaceae bacterium Y1685]|uniref:universal stress protein n=1 Tax=Microlunatus sp. Y1700 TaxID=3418487 RepID=UPI003B7D1F77
MEQQRFTVVVGVSPTSKSETALRWAAAQAAQVDGVVVAVRAWQVRAPAATPSGTSVGRLPYPSVLEQQVRDSLAADVASVLGNDHAVELRTERGGRRKALIKAAREADLLVVDAPRALTVGPMFAHRLVYSAACPVVVMPPRISGEPPSWLQRLARSAGRQAVRSLGTSGRAGTPPRTSPPS